MKKKQPPKRGAPCPFCGQRGLSLVMVKVSTPDISNGFHVECRGCYTCGPIVGSAAAARAAWNRRVP